MKTATNFIYNVVLLVVLGLPLILFKCFIEPTKRGFYIGDESISYPYHSSTIPSWLLYTGSLGIPISCILIYHLLKVNNQSLVEVLMNSISDIFLYGAGTAASQLHTDVCKYTVGRLRPHFFDVCQPSFYIDPTNNQSEFRAVYVTNYTCMGNANLFEDEETRTDRIREVHLSFPSGHSSFAFQAAVFTVWYLHTRYKRLKFCQGNLTVPFLQILFSLMATYTAVSRIMDYKHHPTDVLVGIFIGSLCQIVNTFMGCPNEEESEGKVTSKTSLISHPLPDPASSGDDGSVRNARRRTTNYNSTDNM